jgi:transcriptional regulator with XRE-family HTH domain
VTGPAQGRPSFGDKLASLIETVHPPGRGPYSYREIAAAIAQHPGAMTAAHISQLVRGTQPHPRIHYVEALAYFFGVPVTYFFDDEFAACDEQARQIAERVVELAPRDRNTVLNLIDSLRADDDEHPAEPR